MLTNISALPTRYELLIQTFGSKAPLTFIHSEEDLKFAKRFVTAAKSSGQGKILFIEGSSGSGKSTFVHSLEVFLNDEIGTVARLPLPHDLNVKDIPSYIAKTPSSDKFTVVNFDSREAPSFNEADYRSFFVELNGVLRYRKDILICWPINDIEFAQKMVSLMNKIGGNSAFAKLPIYNVAGIDKTRYREVLDKILRVANWRLEDAAISEEDVAALIESSERIGEFLDLLQELITDRFNVDNMGIDFPVVVVAVSSGEGKIREICRSLRRADSFYIEALRLLMYTKRSNVSEWWQNRSKDSKSALPYVVSIFNAQLVSLSASSVVHSILQFGEQDLKALIEGVRADKGNARKVIQSSELYKFLSGSAADNREYGSSVKQESFRSYDRVQKSSEILHKKINFAIMEMINDAGANVGKVEYEKSLRSGLQTDAVCELEGKEVAIEFHHKAESESNHNRIAIYILEKLKEYAINYGLAER